MRFILFFTVFSVFVACSHKSQVADAPGGPIPKSVDSFPQFDPPLSPGERDVFIPLQDASGQPFQWEFKQNASFRGYSCKKGAVLINNPREAVFTLTMKNPRMPRAKPTCKFKYYIFSYRAVIRKQDMRPEWLDVYGPGAKSEFYALQDYSNGYEGDVIFVGHEKKNEHFSDEVNKPGARFYIFKDGQSNSPKIIPEDYKFHGIVIPNQSQVTFDDIGDNWVHEIEEIVAQDKNYIKHQKMSCDMVSLFHRHVYKCRLAEKLKFKGYEIPSGTWVRYNLYDLPQDEYQEHNDELTVQPVVLMDIGADMIVKGVNYPKGSTLRVVGDGVTNYILEEERYGFALEPE